MSADKTATIQKKNLHTFQKHAIESKAPHHSHRHIRIINDFCAYRWSFVIRNRDFLRWRKHSKNLPRPPPSYPGRFHQIQVNSLPPSCIPSPTPLLHWILNNSIFATTKTRKVRKTEIKKNFVKRSFPIQLGSFHTSLKESTSFFWRRRRRIQGRERSPQKSLSNHTIKIRLISSEKNENKILWPLESQT